MSFLMGVLTGFLNGDAEIMQEQREYDAKIAEDKRKLRQELDKEDRKFIQQIKQNDYKNVGIKYNNINQGIIDGKLSIKEGVNLDKARKLEEKGVLLGVGFTNNINNLVNIIDKTNKFNSMYGKGTYAFNYMSEYQTKPTWGNAFSLLQQISGNTGTASELARLKNAPPAVKLALSKAIMGATQIYSDGFHKNTIGDFDPKTTVQVYPSEKLYKEGEVFGGLTKVKKVLGMSTGFENDIIDSVNMVANKSTESNQAGGNQQKYDTYFIVNGLDYGGFNYPQEEKAGMEIVKKIAPNKDFKYAGATFLKESPVEDLTISDEEKIKVFNRGIKIASMQGAKGLDPNRSLLTYSNEEIIKFNNVIFDGKVIKQGNIRLAGAAMMGIMETPDENLDSSKSSRFINYTGSEYMSLQRTGTVPRGDKSKQDLSVRYNALRESVQQIRLLQGNVATLSTTDAFAKLKEIVIGVFSTSEGFLGDIVKEFSSTSDFKVGGRHDLGNGEFKDAVTQDYIDELQEGLSKKRGLAAEIEALRISLAFKMARAADPSGRLSNQDIDLQLRRLGGGAFASPAFAVAQINTVLNDFQRELDSVEIFYKYGQKDGRLTKNEARFIDAVISANYINKKMQEIQNPASADLPDSKLTVQDLTLENGYKKVENFTGVFLKGIDYYQQTGTKENGTPIGTLIPEDKEDEILKKLRIRPEGSS